MKVLGALGLIDQSEADWKIIAIDVNDPLAVQLNDINDVETVMPGLLNATRDWFRFCKVPNGKPENKFAFNGQFMGREFALKLIKETHRFWKKLVMSEQMHEELNCTNVSVDGSPHIISQYEANGFVKAAKYVAEQESTTNVVEKWYFLKE